MTQTLHERVIMRHETASTLSPRKARRRSAMRRLVADVVAGHDWSTEPHLDYRADGGGAVWSGRGWRIGDPIRVGSGRAAEWCHVAYLQYALIAQLVHRHLGWSGQIVRDTARALQRAVDGGGHDWQPPERALPVRELLRIAALPPEHDWHFALESRADGDAAAQHRLAWRVWTWRVVSPAWGRYMLRHEIARLRADPTATTRSLIVGELRRLRGATDVSDMRGCSGCQYLRHIPELDSETQDYLLSRAAAARPVKLRGGIEAVAVPFGLAYPPEFDHALVLGLSGELRVRSADWARLEAHEQARVIRGEA